MIINSTWYECSTATCVKKYSVVGLTFEKKKMSKKEIYK